MDEGGSDVKTLGRPARNSYQLLRTGVQRCYRQKSTAMGFSKNKSEMGGSRERGFAYYNDQGNNAGIVQIPAVPSSSSKFRIYTVGPDTQRVTFSSAQNGYFNKQVCDEVCP